MRAMVRWCRISVDFSILRWKEHTATVPFLELGRMMMMMVGKFVLFEI